MTGKQSGEPLTLMAVHAHPDDECIGTGGVLAKYAAEGARTVLVTATRGEEGEIHDPDLTEEEARPRLAEIREGELRRAVAILGVGALEFLGYRDSGMMGTPANEHPDNFHNADRGEAVGRLVRLIRQYRPQVIVTYNVDGGYGHPDHLQTHRVTWRAFDAAGDPARYPEAGPPWQPSKLYATAWSREGWQKMIAELQRRGLPLPFEDDEPAEQPAEGAPAAAEASTEQSSPERKEDEQEEWGQPDDSITTFVDVAPYWRAVRDALRAHRTQFAPDSRFLNMPDDLAALSNSTEHFVLLRSRVPTTRPEDDLFQGVRG
ncbi:MAG TPA: PIG-L family deacetylase [Thermomicrobiales bacterium]|nr:PIG-L family deacetylase [Thermomicrobiales bacterium]